jgi:hypothetical protein
MSVASAQTPASPPPAAPGPAKAVAKKKPAPKAAAKPANQANAGTCQVGIIVALDLFSVQKIGLTAFGNGLDEVRVSWGLDDVVLARARAAAGATPVRKIAYVNGAFDSYYKREGGLGNLFRNYRGELTNTVRPIAGNAGCERYLVVMRGDGQFPGTNQPLTGVGVVHRGAGFIEYTFLFANVRIVIFDGQTFEIRQNPVTLDGVMQHLASSLLTNRDMDKIDNSAFPAVAADAAQSAALRDGTRSLLERRLDKIFPAFFQP